MACGGAGRNASSVSHLTSTTASSTASAGRYLNDGDAEKVNDNDSDNGSGNHDDGDADSSEEYETTFDNGNYHDQDDKSVLEHGHPASSREERAISSVVRRYYAAAAAGDGEAACSMLVPSLAAAAPTSYGGAAGPLYLRGATTCRSVVSRVFRHYQRLLTGAVEVTGVRSEGHNAFALLGSTTMAASDIPVEQINGAWMIGSVIGSALP
jgi:hypothetical protein